VRAATGYDAISHAVETWVTTKRNSASDEFSMKAWRLLEPNYERVLVRSEGVEANGAMMQGAFFAGAAIEHSMLGATHACANPLTARYGTVHGVAIALLLAHVVRWNAPTCSERYEELANAAGVGATAIPGCGQTGGEGGSEALARRLEALAEAGGLRTRLRDAGVPREDLPALAQGAAKEWTGRFNPRPFDAAGALEVFQCAY
jgi:alcohol dehydrogenase